MSDLVPHLKKDAIVSIKIGTGFVERLSQVLFYITSTVDKKELKNPPEKEPHPEWVKSVITIQSLMKEVFNEAEKLGMVEYKELSKLDGLPSDPSPQ